MELHDLAAEQCIIGACLIDNRYIEKAMELVKPVDFYRQAHQMIFEVIVNLTAQHKISDLVTVCDELRKANKLDMIGGAVVVSEMTNDVPSGANLAHYASIVIEMHHRRLLLALGQELVNRCQREDAGINETIDFLDKQLLQIVERKVQGYRPIQDFVVPAITEIEDDFKNKGKLKGIPTGFAELNYMTSGFQKQDLILIGARPSIGKTTLEIQAMIECAIHHGKKAGFFSLEMSGNKITRKMISNIGNVSGTSMKQGTLRESEFADIQDAAGRIYESKIFMNESPNMGILDLERESRAMKRKEGVEIIFIDYIGLIQHPNPKLERHRQVAEISIRLKALARELDIPIVSAAQLTRDDEGKMPTLKSLSETKQLEQDADLIIFLHRDGPPDSHEDKLKLIVAKQRDGAIGIFDILHKKAFGKMVQEYRE